MLGNAPFSLPNGPDQAEAYSVLCIERGRRWAAMDPDELSEPVWVEPLMGTT